jgi:serine/threonine-protein kinase
VTVTSHELDDDRHELLGPLGRGGMADVFLARRFAAGGVERLVVLKRLRPEQRADPERTAAFADEARLLAAAAPHPNIVQVLDAEERDGVLVLVLEHVRGVTLRALLDRARATGAGRLPHAEGLGVVFHVAEALAHLHELLDELGSPLGFVHRDVNPSNIMVGYDGSVKLLDFGIAKADVREVLTRTGVIKGTPGYMPPEQLAGGSVDRRADVFSLGLLLYEVATGTAPELGAARTPSELVRALDDLPRARDVVSGIDPAVDHLIVHALRPEPSARLATVAELRDVVANALVRLGTWPTLESIGSVVRALAPDPDAGLPDRTVPLRSDPRWPARRALRGVLALVLVVVVGAVAFLLGRALVP